MGTSVGPCFKAIATKKGMSEVKEAGKYRQAGGSLRASTLVACDLNKI
jgi:hypothetical protein